MTNEPLRCKARAARCCVCVGAHRVQKWVPPFDTVCTRLVLPVSQVVVHRVLVKVWPWEDAAQIVGENSTEDCARDKVSQCTNGVSIHKLSRWADEMHTSCVAARVDVIITHNLVGALACGRREGCEGHETCSNASLRCVADAGSGHRQ